VNGSVGCWSCARSADCKSAIQQITNLRYVNGEGAELDTRTLFAISYGFLRLVAESHGMSRIDQENFNHGWTPINTDAEFDFRIRKRTAVWRRNLEVKFTAVECS
jgi:hypothetical protein